MTTPPQPRIRVVRWWLSVVALTLGIILMAVALTVTWRTWQAVDDLKQRIQQVGTVPTPEPTGCPFGEQDCGG